MLSLKIYNWPLTIEGSSDELNQWTAWEEYHTEPDPASRVTIREEGILMFTGTIKEASEWLSGYFKKFTRV